VLHRTEEIADLRFADLPNSEPTLALDRGSSAVPLGDQVNPVITLAADDSHAIPLLAQSFRAPLLELRRRELAKILPRETRPAETIALSLCPAPGEEGRDTECDAYSECAYANSPR
jgi:hypothetical protein